MIHEQVTVRDCDGLPDVSVGTIRGEVDLANASAIGRQLLSTVPNTARGLVLDLSLVEYLDSAGLDLLFNLAERFGARQQRLEVVVPAANDLRVVLRIAQLDAVVGIWESVQQAASAAVSSRGREP